MKKTIPLFSLFLMLALCGYLPKCRALSSIEPLTLTIWSEYKANHFDHLSKEGKTEKLKVIFEDQYTFVKRHCIPHLVIKILDPLSFPFFHPKNFNSDQPDNILYWLNQLALITKIDLLFDKEPFNIESISYITSFYATYQAFISHLQMDYPPFGDFENLIEKLDWVSSVIQFHAKESYGQSLVYGMILDPTGVNPTSPFYQNLINALDAYKHSNHSLFDDTPFPNLKTGMLFPLDKRDLALANLASFPLTRDLKGDSPTGLGIKLPTNFPSNVLGSTLPPWRRWTNKDPLLDRIFLQLADQRLESIYQNYAIFPEPLQRNPQAVAQLADDLSKNFRGVPFSKGPGTISNERGSFYLKGTDTFFQVGTSYHSQGLLRKGQMIEIKPPFSKESIFREVSEDPSSNNLLKLKAPFSLITSLKEANYYYTPIPTSWAKVKTSRCLQSRIHFVFSAEFKVNGNQYFGNWSLDNFISFFIGTHPLRGFLDRPVFRNLSDRLTCPIPSNISLSCYSRIPNGTPYEQVNWELGNTSIEEVILDKEGLVAD